MPTVVLTARLYSNSTPLSNKTVSFFYRATGTTAWILIGDSTTLAGTCNISVNLDEGAYDFRAYFAGDEDYEASEAIVTNFEVKAVTKAAGVQIPSWLIAVIIAILILLLLVKEREGEE